MCAKTSGTLQKQEGHFLLHWTTLMHNISLARDKLNQRTPTTKEDGSAKSATAKKVKSDQKEDLLRQKQVENPSIDLGAYRMRSGRSTNELVPRHCEVLLTYAQIKILYCLKFGKRNKMGQTRRSRRQKK